MAKLGGEDLGRRLKLAALLLLYPGATWFLVNAAGASGLPPNWTGTPTLVSSLNTALYVVVAIGFLFMGGVPLWSSRYRHQPEHLTAAFRPGLLITSAVIALILPVQGALLALGLYVADPKELWVWGIFAFGGSVAGTVVLLQSGLGKQPGVYLTLRAARIQLDQHPRLEGVLLEVSDVLGVPLPPHILVGLQPEMTWTAGTVFCPDGELEGGVLCISLPASYILSIPEFRALTGEALLGLQAWLREGRTQFLSTTEAARDVLHNLDETMREWSWFPKWGLHPAIAALRLAGVAAMRIPLYIGKEWLTYYLKEFWISRQAVDARHSAEAHRSSTGDVGAVQVVSALVKEAAFSLAMWFELYSDGRAVHPLGEVAEQVRREHFDLKVERQPSTYHDPQSAWQFLQFRCNLSSVSLDWCLKMALNVSPQPSAASLLENVAALQAKVVELVDSPFVRVKR